jgi:hypothetical protein
MMIGLITMSAVVWVLASCMAVESDAEKRRLAILSGHGLPDVVEKVRPAA